MRAAQPPADLSHRSRLSPSNSPLYEIHLTSFPLPTLLHVFYRFDLLMFLSLFYDFSFYILILFFFSLLHKTDRLLSATDFHADITHAMQYRARGNKTRGY